MEKLFLERGADPTEIQSRLEQAARAEGLPFGKREKTYNSRLAQELGKWAESKGKGEKFHDALFHTCLVEGLNISKVSVLVEVARSLGLPREEAAEVLETSAFKKSVDLDWTRSRMMRVTAIPTLVINEGFLIGAQPYERMAQFMRANNIKELEFY